MTNRFLSDVFLNRRSLALVLTPELGERTCTASLGTHGQMVLKLKKSTIEVFDQSVGILRVISLFPPKRLYRKFSKNKIRSGLPALSECSSCRNRSGSPTETEDKPEIPFLYVVQSVTLNADRL